MCCEADRVEVVAAVCDGNEFIVVAICCDGETNREIIVLERVIR